MPPWEDQQKIWSLCINICMKRGDLRVGKAFQACWQRHKQMASLPSNCAFLRVTYLISLCLSCLWMESSTDLSQISLLPLLTNSIPMGTSEVVCCCTPSSTLSVKLIWSSLASPWPGIFIIIIIIRYWDSSLSLHNLLSLCFLFSWGSFPA